MSIPIYMCVRVCMCVYIYERSSPIFSSDGRGYEQLREQLFVVILPFLARLLMTSDADLS